LTDLPIRERGPISGNSQYADAALQTGAIAVDQNDYSILPDSTVLDRVYNVKGLDNMHVEIENTGLTENGLIYTIEKARKEFKLITELVEADFDEVVVSDTTVIAGALANGTVTLLGVLAGDTITVNGLIYTAVAGAKANNTQFSIDGTDTVDAADLVDSITNDTRQGTLNDITAANVLGVVTMTQTVPGIGGNATTLVSSEGTRLAVSGALFTGGVDAITAISDIVEISPEGTAVRIKIKRETSGQDTTLAGIVSVD